LRGVKFWENPKNKFGVIQIHYTADPDKDPETEKGKAWYDQVRPGMPEEGWLREMEISWATMEGAPVYAEVKPEQVDLDLDWDSRWVIYRGWDLGYHHPAVHFSCVNSETDQWLWLNEFIEVDTELRKFGLHVIDFTHAVFPNAMIRDFLPHDAFFVKDVSTEKEERTAKAILENVGIFPEFTRSDLMSGINLIRRKMLMRQDGKFGMLVDKNCKVATTALLGGYHRSPKPERANIPVKDGLHDHIMDAARMTAVNIFQPEMTESLKDGLFIEPDYIYDEITGCVVG